MVWSLERDKSFNGSKIWLFHSSCFSFFYPSSSKSEKNPEIKKSRILKNRIIMRRTFAIHLMYLFIP